MSDPKAQKNDPTQPDAGEGPMPDIEDSFATGSNAEPGQTAPDDPIDITNEPTMADRIAALEAEKEAQRDQLLRAVAEAENGRRRAEREKEETAKFAISKFARDLLDVSDNLRRALEATEGASMAATVQNDDGVRVLVEGVAATERSLLQVLEKHGLIKIMPLDEKFDPNFHQAMVEIPTDDKPPGTVVQVMQPGYVLNGRLIRPALVGVAKGQVAKKVDTTA
ncbi:MAG: nucleotide exchange factor GrpE [Pseudomonadota bacterium]